MKDFETKALLKSYFSESKRAQLQFSIPIQKCLTVILNNMSVTHLKVKIWRRSFDIPPPPMEVDHPYYNDIVKDPRYKKGPPEDEFPRCESLKSTMERTIPYWEQTIVPQLRRGKRVLIAAHGNSLRGIIKYLECEYKTFVFVFKTFCSEPYTYMLEHKTTHFLIYHQPIPGCFVLFRYNLPNRLVFFQTV